MLTLKTAELNELKNRIEDQIEESNQLNQIEDQIDEIEDRIDSRTS